MRFRRSACDVRRKSGRRDSNSRHPAWEASALPLSYARVNQSANPIWLDQISVLSSKVTGTFPVIATLGRKNTMDR